ncbi:MAG: hypothetical protein IPN83_00065 [Holophagales bacterium]|nr:hypothetical protein [Holophagales bacterium]
MSRPKSDKTKSDRARKPLTVTPTFVRRPTLAQLTDTTEGWWRQLAERGDGPPVIRIGRVRLYDFAQATEWLRRNAA